MEGKVAGGSGYDVASFRMPNTSELTEHRSKSMDFANTG